MGDPVSGQLLRPFMRLKFLPFKNPVFWCAAILFRGKVSQSCRIAVIGPEESR